MIAVSFFNLGLMFLVFSLTINNHQILASFGFNQESNFVSFVIFLKLYEVISWVTSLLQNLLSRRFEYQADAFAADEYREALARGLVKIHVANASNLVPDPFYAGMHFSHPTLSERLEALGNPYVPREKRDIEILPATIPEKGELKYQSLVEEN